jgi:hypothetical protein
MNKSHKRLLALLETTFNPEGDIHFLAIAEKQIQVHEKEQSVHQVRVALTFKEGDGINPYYDGTDVFMVVDGDDISFTREEEWADGPPLVEGSPVELAVGWVSGLAEPFYISPEALAATQPSPHFVNGNDDTDDHYQEKEGSGN